MHAPACLQGHWVSVTPRRAPLADLMQAYLASPQAFERQFGRPVQDLGAVLALAESALAHGFSSYFDVRLRADGTVIGHLRVDWSLEEEGLIALHGGSPLQDPDSPGHRQRAHARARREAWQLMVQAALATPGVQRVGTATAASNRAAQAFIAASGFRRTRILQLPDGRETLVHYRLVRDWLGACAQPASEASLAAYRPPAPRGTAPAPVAAAQSDTPPAPPGWTRIDASNAPRWIGASSTAFLHHLADAPPAPVVHASRDDLVQTLYFEAANGTHFFGHEATEGPDPLQALIAVKPLPGRPGWWLLRGGPLAHHGTPPSLRPWLDDCFAHASLRRVEAQVPAHAGDALAWWRACGLGEEGTTEIDGQGHALATTLARVAT